MNKVYVAGRVETRHPEQQITKSDAAAAWNRAVASRARVDTNPNEYIAIGIDEHGRAMELVAVRDAEGDFLIYHAFTPPTMSAKIELGLEGRRRRR